ncbi:type VI secretion system protein TssA [Bordetella bronchialis]|uniref:ImpA N-terminal domain-containing protein n=1 Tax=Bordetella bronchialis TaxID=463025 RepID=A0A193G270_9BORD|nr:type VI secretion system protein TssA [Bordetella bronchialis]ANN68400.1 hypothetical protein BAU06_20735 [Bordetella bronchialis]ANN73541.1 hypothetical protein BAU08_21265 [Bordetella bronchialis]
MPVVDVASLLPAIAPETPCGPDLEYSAEYVALLQLMRGTPDVEYGKMRQAAADPDWKAVKSAALELLARTRDLRLAVWLTRALAALHGFGGLDDGLSLVEGYIERHWAHVHPRLDAEDDNDPTERVNTLVALEEKSGLLRQVYTLPLAESPLHGGVSLRDLDLADGAPGVSGDENRMDAAAVDAVFKTADPQALGDAAACLARAAARADRIEALVTERVGHARAVALRELRQLLSRAAGVAGERLAAHPERRAARAAAGEAAADDPAGAAGGAIHATQPDGLPAGCGIPRSRDDVVAAIDRICDYYAREEPGSPVPLLLRRAQRLVGLAFIDLLGDLSPDSVAQVNHIAGIAG